jgi:hypothetical protein
VTAPPPADPEAADLLKSRLAVEDPYDRVRLLAIPVTPVAPSAGKSSERASPPPAESRRVEISVARGHFSIEPGREESCQVRVRNRGTIVEQFALELVGDDVTWAVVEPGRLNVYPGTDMSATIWLRPPRTAGTLAGSHRFVVRATSTNDPTVTAEAELLVDLAVFHAMSAQLDPHGSRARWWWRPTLHALKVHNSGNALLAATITASDPENALSFRLVPGRIRVAPGVEEVAQIRVRPRRPLWFGAPRVNSFSLEVVGEGREGAYVEGQDGGRVEGQLTQLPLIPRWLVRAAGLAIPLVAAILIFLRVTATTAVPDLGHVSKNVAEQKLKAAGFLVKESTGQTDVVPVDSVMSQDPVGGSHQHRGSTIALVISAGPTPAGVPDVIGEDEARARADLLRPPGRFVVDQVMQRADATAPRGTVIDTDPRRSQLAAPGSVVTLFLSSGPSPAAAPPTVAAPPTKPPAAAPPVVVPPVLPGALTPPRSSQPPASSSTGPPSNGVGNSNNGPPPPAAARFAATWTNLDPNTSDITRAAVRFDATQIYIHLWGKCSPTDCDWGEAYVPVANASTGTLPVKFVFSFAEETQQVTLVGDQLKITGTTHYTDNSGRTDRSYTDLFNKTGPAPTRTGADPFLGSWTNSNPNTNDITRAALRTDPATLYVHMWGKCSPTDCDWGETSAPLASANGGTLSLRWVFSFKVETQTLTLLPDGRLHVQGLAHYTDNSGRVDRSYTDDFARA